MNATENLACQKHKENYSRIKELLNNKVFSFKRDNGESILMLKRTDFRRLELIISNPVIKVEFTDSCYILRSEYPECIVEVIQKVLQLADDSKDNFQEVNIGQFVVA